MISIIQSLSVMNQVRNPPHNSGKNQTATQRIGFLLFPTFSMLSFIAAIEPLRAANHCSDKNLYSWHVYSPDGQDIVSCNGMAYTSDAAFVDVNNIDILFVCGPHDLSECVSLEVCKELNRLSGINIKLGGIDTGAYILARANLLGNHRCVIHWEALADFENEFPELSVSTELFALDRDRLTCVGGTAAMEMMSHLVSLQNGESLAKKISKLFSYQKSPGCTETCDSRLLDCIAIMESNREKPLLTHEIASAVNLSVRQLERLFQQHFKVTPIQHYLALRIAHAKELLDQTSLSLLDISLQTGFSSPSHFSQYFRKRYGVTPKQYRHR